MRDLSKDWRMFGRWASEPVRTDLPVVKIEKIEERIHAESVDSLVSAFGPMTTLATHRVELGDVLTRQLYCDPAVYRRWSIRSARAKIARLLEERRESAAESLRAACAKFDTIDR